MYKVPALFLIIFSILCSCTGDKGKSTPFVHHSIVPKYLNGHISAQTVADIDNDGFLDIVIRSGKSGKAEIAWLRNPLAGDSGQRSWKKFIISHAAYPSGQKSSGSGIIVTDLNGDGRPDIITGAKLEGIGNALCWWECPKDVKNGLWKRNLIKAPDKRTGEEFAPHSIILHDINLDGSNDLVIGGSSNQGVYWMRIPKDPHNSSSWNLLKIGGPRGFAFAGLAVGDIDRDGRPDVIRSDMLYRASGPLETPVWIPSLYGLQNVPPSNIVLYDVDEDGWLDIVVSSGHNFSEGYVAWYKIGTDPGKHWQAYPISRKLRAPENLVLLDWNNDGKPEVITAELRFSFFRGARCFMYSFTGSENTWHEIMLDKNRNYHLMGSADLDKDGDVDLYAGSFEERNSYAHLDWFENTLITQSKQGSNK